MVPEQGETYQTGCSWVEGWNILWWYFRSQSGFKPWSEGCCLDERCYSRIQAVWKSSRWSLCRYVWYRKCLWVGTEALSFCLVWDWLRLSSRIITWLVEELVRIIITEESPIAGEAYVQAAAKWQMSVIDGIGARSKILLRDVQAGCFFAFYNLFSCQHCALPL